jgi:hypothetical protein
MSELLQFALEGIGGVSGGFLLAYGYDRWFK